MKTFSKWLSVLLVMDITARAQEGGKPVPEPEHKPPAESPAKEPGKPAEVKGVPVSPTGAQGATRARRKKDVMLKIPASFKEKNIQEASVRILITVGTEGQVEDARIQKTSGFPEFDEAALEAARQTPFSPKMVDGKPVKDVVVQPYRYRLAKPEEKKEQK
jgi:periplasmic protein TonB